MLSALTRTNEKRTKEKRTKEQRQPLLDETQKSSDDVELESYERYVPPVLPITAMAPSAAYAVDMTIKKENKIDKQEKIEFKNLVVPSSLSHTDNEVTEKALETTHVDHVDNAQESVLYEQLRRNNAALAMDQKNEQARHDLIAIQNAHADYEAEKKKQDARRLQAETDAAIAIIRANANAAAIRIEADAKAYAIQKEADARAAAAEQMSAIYKRDPELFNRMAALFAGANGVYTPAFFSQTPNSRFLPVAGPQVSVADNKNDEASNSSRVVTAASSPNMT